MTTRRLGSWRARVARISGIVVLLIAAGTVTGCALVQQAAAPSGSAPSPASTAMPTPTGMRTVTVQFRDLEGHADGSIAGVLYRGATPVFPDTRVIGGFGAEVSSDLWSDDRVVRQPMAQMDTAQPFPYVTDEPLAVRPGIYTLVLYLSREPLSPYSRWVPAGAFGALTELWGCQKTFTVDQRDITITVTDVPLMDGSVHSCP
jgi:hypothetical protein